MNLHLRSLVLIPFVLSLCMDTILAQTHDFKLNRVQLAIDQGRWQQAGALFQDIDTTKTSSSYLHNYYTLGLLIADSLEDAQWHLSMLGGLITHTPTDKYPEEKLAHFSRYVRLITTTNKEKFLSYQDSIIHLAELLQEPATKAEALLAKSSMYFMYGDTEAFMELNQQVLKMPDARPKDIGRAHLSKASYFAKINYDTAFTHFELAYVHINKEPDSTTLSAYHNTFGGFLNYHGEHTRATEELIRCLQLIPDDSGHRLRQSMTLASIAAIFGEMEDTEKERSYLLQAIHVAEEAGLNYRKKYLASKMGAFYFKEGDWAQAEKEYLQATKAFQLDNYTARYIENTIHLGRSVLMQGNISTASTYRDTVLNYLDESILKNIPPWLFPLFEAELAFAKKKYTSSLIRLNELWHHYREMPAHIRKMYWELKIDALEVTGNYQEALLAMKSYHLLIDTLAERRRATITYDLESQYRAAQKEKQIVALQSENKLHKFRLDQKNLYNKLLAVGISFVVLAGALLLYLYAQSRRQRKLVEQALCEKELLLREIHHRVKNNLQVISSLLNLQSKYIKDSKALDAIKGGRSRVRSMALIHQNLYQENHFLSIPFHDYVQKLLDELVATYKLPDQHIQLKVEADELALDVDTMIPIGLIINELISNTLKYAFHQTGHGIIHIQLYETNQELHLVVSDNGSGLDKDQLESNSESFGYKMIRAFTRKLDGNMQIDVKNGTRVTFAFKTYKITTLCQK
jgi:two-component sensor histidine kinase